MSTVRLVFLIIAAGVLAAVMGCASKAARSTDLKAVAARTAGAGNAIGQAAASATRNVTEAGKAAQEVAGHLGQEAQTIRHVSPAHADKVDGEARRLQADVVPRLDDARQDLAGIQTQAAALKTDLAPEIQKADREVETLTRQLADAQAALQKERESVATGIRRALVWVIIGGVVLLAAGVLVAVKLDPTAGLGLSAGALALVGSAALVYRYLEWLALGAAVAAAALVVVLGLALWRSWKQGQLATGFSRVAEALKAQVPADVGKTVLDTIKAVVDPAQTAAYQDLKANGQLAGTTASASGEG